MEIATVVSACLSAFVSLVSLISAFINYNNAKRASQGNIELQIRQMIFNAQFNLTTFLIDVQNNKKIDVRTKQNQLDYLYETILNAYDEACSKYLDNKTDKERFKKMYISEIDNLFNSDSFKNILLEKKSRFNAIVEVHEEWHNKD